MNGVSPIPDADRIAELEGAEIWRIWRLRRCHSTKATTTSNRPVIPPMIAPTFVAKCDAFGSAVGVGCVVVVVLTRMFCTGTLRTGVVSVEIATQLKRTSEPTAQALHLAQDLREREAIVRT